MTHKTILLTGASDGIGAEAAHRLAAKGHRLLLAGRSPEKTERVARETGGQGFVADFARFDDVRRLAHEIDETLGDDGLDVLANNAGGIFGTAEPTVDGHEKTMQVGHLSPFLLTSLLLPRLLQAQGAVVSTSSIANLLFGHLDVDDLDNRRRFSANKAYGDTKLADAIFAKTLHHRFAPQGLRAVAFHPGVIATNFASETTSALSLLYRTPLRRFLTTPQQGGATLEWFLEGAFDARWRSGAYYGRRRISDMLSRQAGDPALADALWERSEQLVGLR